MSSSNTNWHQSVTAVCIKNGKVLLARHTYGAGKGRLIIPGGYVENGEFPQEAVVREFMEETNIVIKPKKIIGIRFNLKDWYIAFSADYISGNAKSDHNENSEVLWLPVDEALSREDVPDLTKKLIECALTDNGFESIDYIGKNPPYCLFGMK